MDQHPQQLITKAQSNQKHKPAQIIYNSDIHKLITAIELNHMKIARNIAFSQDFIASNQAFVRSGQAIQICIRLQNLVLAQELMTSGYTMPVNFLLRKIHENDKKAVKNLIQRKYFTQNVDLQFWFLIYRGWTNLAQEFLQSSSSLLNSYGQVVKFEKLKNDKKLIEVSLKQALLRNINSMLGLLIHCCPYAITPALVKIAIENNNIDFLRRLWIGDHSIDSLIHAKKRYTRGTIIQHLKKAVSPEDQELINQNLKISSILEYLLSHNRAHEAAGVLQWPDAVNQPNVLQVLVKYNQQDLASQVIKRRKNLISIKDFNMSMQTRNYWLSIEILRHRHTQSAVKNPLVQLPIVELLQNGENCLYAAEMLALINVKNWDFDLTKQLCENVEYFIKKTSEILKCPKPLLFLVLMAEFVKKLETASVQYGSICRNTFQHLIRFASEIEKNLLEQEFLEYYLLQKDINDRSTLLIIAFNNFYELLNNDDIGSIVSKLWIGERKHNGMLKASTIYNSSISQTLEGSLAFFQRIDKNKPYIFQYEQWKESCSLRFLGQAVSILFLVYFYTMMIHHATLTENLQDISQDTTSLVYLRLSQI